MKRILTLVAIIAISFNFVSCDGEAKKQAEQIETLKAEVMKIHDDAMAKMGDLGTLANELEQQATAMKSDSTLMSDSAAMATQLTTYDNAITAINDAKSGMMEWMNTFKAPADEASFEEKMAFYQEEKEKVITVMEDINASLENGATLK